MSETTTDLRIEGMSCNHCVAAVKGALERVPGVAEARVDLATGTARVVGTADAAQLVAAVTGEGYRAAPLQP
ncbi:MAG TPA: heavy-metal-associated domain-containing protein [Trueperaceae bacterium]|jgi:copper chaperone